MSTTGPILLSKPSFLSAILHCCKLLKKLLKVESKVNGQDVFTEFSNIKRYSWFSLPKLKKSHKFEFSHENILTMDFTYYLKVKTES